MNKASEAEWEFHDEVSHVSGIFETGVSKEAKAQKIANLLAAMEVYVDTNYTEQEQEKLFEMAGHRVAELRKMLG